MVGQKATTPHPREEETNVPAQTGTSSAVFTGGSQGWVDLKLEKVDMVNHNTKRFRFVFPDPDSVSGLQVACTFEKQSPDEISVLTRADDSGTVGEVSRSDPGQTCYSTIYTCQ